MQKITWLVLVMILAFWTLAAGPAVAQDAGAVAGPDQPAAPPAAEKKEETPTTAGPIITDTCIPIGEHQASLSVSGGPVLLPGRFHSQLA